MSLYPTDKEISVLGQKIRFPGLDPKTGKFTNGYFNDDGGEVPASVIPAESINLIMDLMDGLCRKYGNTTNNHDPDQLYNLPFADTRDIEAMRKWAETWSAAMKKQAEEWNAAFNRRAAALEQTFNALFQDGACGYRLRADNTAPGTVTLYVKPQEGDYFVNLSLATNDDTVNLSWKIFFTLHRLETEARWEVSGVRLDTSGSTGPSNMPLPPEVFVSMNGNSQTAITINLNYQDQTITTQETVNSSRSPVVITNTTHVSGPRITSWRGTVEGSVTSPGGAPVGTKNLAVLWFGPLVYGGFYNTDNAAAAPVIGDLDYDFAEFDALGFDAEEGLDL